MEKVKEDIEEAKETIPAVLTKGIVIRILGYESLVSIRHH